MRVVLVPQGTHGDVRPLVALGTALREAGHDICFGTSLDHHAWLEGLGFSVHRVARFMAVPSEQAERAVGNPLRVLWNGVKFVMELVPAQFADLEPLLEGADLVIGSGLEFAGRSLAERRGIPYRFLCHVPTAVRSRFHPPVAIPFRTFPTWVNRLLWWSNTLGTKLTFGRQIQAQRRRLGMAPVRDLSRYFSSDIVLAADGELAPMPSDCRVEFRTGYFALSDKRALPNDLVAFLENGPPPIYWGFGSMVDPQPARTLRTLEELSMSRRLVVFNRRAQRLRPEGTPNLHWVDDVSHEQLFRRVAAVVHHGGAGTTHTAARAGVPQIIVPHLVDQYYWAHRVHQLGIGAAPLRLRGLSAASVAAALDQIVSGSSIQRRAIELAGELEKPAQCAIREMVTYLGGIPESAARQGH